MPREIFSCSVSSAKVDASMSRGLAAVLLSLPSAWVHQVKGNIGPGCLALPCVFARIGPTLGVPLVLAVTIPGGYAMLVLVRLKRALCEAGHPVMAYEDVAAVAVGPSGRRLLEWVIMTLQLGGYANYIGSHFWNMQEECMSYDMEGERSLENSEIRADILWRQSGETVVPRLMTLDVKSARGALRRRGYLGLEEAVPQESVSFDVSVDAAAWGAYNPSTRSSDTQTQA